MANQYGVKFDVYWYFLDETINGNSEENIHSPNPTTIPTIIPIVEPTNTPLPILTTIPTPTPSIDSRFTLLLERVFSNFIEEMVN